VRLLTGSLFVFIVAALVGLGATWLSLTGDLRFGALTIGSWTAYPRIGTPDADPYARASIVRTGLLPIGLGDGVSFIARHDDAGRPLDGRCTIAVSGMTPAARFWTLTLYNAGGGLVANSLGRYGFTSQEVLRHADGRFTIAVSGMTPAARFWTLTLYNAGGGLVANSLGRYGFTSQEVLRHADGRFTIAIAPRASAGNWLPTGGVERYQLALRLYDTPVGVATRAGNETPMPQIVTTECP